MSIQHVVRTFSIGALIVVGAGLVSAQGYPTKPIRIVTSAPGGANDFAARLIAQALSISLGQPLIVDNRTTFIATETVAKAQSDGYTLLIAGNPLWILPLMQKVSYDPVRDFSPISMVCRQPNVLVVHPAVAANSVKELVALAKARPGALNYAWGAPGGSAQLAAELFKAMAGVDIVGVPYKGGGPGVIAVLGGEVQLTFATAPTVISQIRSGKLRALAVTSADPSAFIPGVPTVAASGLPGYESVLVLGMFAPAHTSTVAINTLNRELAPFLNRTEVKEKFLSGGVEAVSSSPSDLASYMKSEAVRMGKVIRNAGIRAD